MKSSNSDYTGHGQAGHQKEDFAVVFEEQFSGIYNYVYARILHRERTEDLVSEIFIKAMKHYDGFQTENFRPFGNYL